MLKIIGTVLLLAMSCVCVADGERTVANGQTVAEVIAILGKPDGTISMGKETHLIYAGTMINVSGGVVSGLPENFNETLASARKERQDGEAFVREQKSKGLVLYKNEWMTEDEKKVAVEKERAQRQLAAFKKRQEAETEKIKEHFGIGKTNPNGPVHQFVIRRDDGSVVDHRSLAIPGKVALVLFHRKGAPFCSIFMKDLLDFVDSDPCIELYQIDFSSNDDPLVYSFHIDKRANYFVRVIDPEGRVCSGTNFAVDMLKQYVAQAKKQCGL